MVRKTKFIHYQEYIHSLYFEEDYYLPNNLHFQMFSELSHSGGKRLSFIFVLKDILGFKEKDKHVLWWH